MGTTVQAKVERNKEEENHRIQYSEEENTAFNIGSSTGNDTQMSYTGGDDVECDSAVVSDNHQTLTGNNSDLAGYQCSSPDKMQSKTRLMIEEKKSPEASEVKNQVEEETNSGEKQVVRETSDNVKKNETLNAEGRKRKWSRLESLRNEEVRLQTFDNWPDMQFISPEDLAKAGFFYLKKEDIVQCAFCRGMVGIWEKGDDPMCEHQRHFPQCNFVLKIDVGNTAQSGSEQPKNCGCDTVSRYVHEVCPKVVNEESTDLLRNFNIKTLNGNQNKSIEALGVNSCTGPYSFDYVSSEERLISFSDWPLDLPQPRRLADAGFYYVHLSDHVKCFYCNGGLRNWKPEDDPWIEHARWFPKCQYVLLLKGHEFVNMVTGNTGTQLIKQTMYDETAIPQTSSATNKQIQKNMGISGASNVPIQLEAENRRLKAAYTCKICFDKEVGVVFLPCGHLVTCVACATAVSKCPICRQSILGIARTFIN